MDNVELQQLIAAFLKVNPNPTDQQFHALAMAANIDHETLEAISYSMLAEDQGSEPEQQQVSAGNPAPSEDQLSEQQQVLDGDYDPNTTSPNDLLLNDGGTDSSSLQLNQDSTYDDGVGPDDVGVDINGDKDAMISDGGPAVQLKAATRLSGL
jgi:hypothetical protein